MRIRRCPPRLKRCCAQLLVTGIVALMLFSVAYLQEPAPPLTLSEFDANLAAGGGGGGARRPRPHGGAPLHPPPSERQPKPSRPRPPRRAVVAIIHQSWSEGGNHLPPLFARWSSSFNACFPTFKRILWSDADNRELIARHYPWFLHRYDSLAPGVQRADVSRLFYMHKHGGIYCDLDCECLRGFEHLLESTSLAFGAMAGSLISKTADPAFVPEGQVENSFMYSLPKHPFFWDLILRMNSTEGEMPIMTSGPYLIMSGINAARKIGRDRTYFEGLPYLTIYPPQLFNPYSWLQPNQHPNCRLYGEFTSQTLSKCRASFLNASYVVQYHTQVWDKGKANVLRLPPPVHGTAMTTVVTSTP